jgi:hypothetical protein
MTSPGLSWKLGFFAIIGFWALVSLGDYPAPFIDDAFYIGAAINLAQHGVFSNPYCEMLATIGCSDHFFANMPLHDYLLAGWLKLFGISTLSFHVLYTLLALAVALLIYRLLPTVRFSWAAALLICLAVYGLLGGSGLRADALGFCFLLLGFDAWKARTVFHFFWKNFFLGLVVITFPNLAIPAMLLSLAALLHQKLFRQKTIRDLVPFALAMGAAYGICFVIFLICIDFRLFEFLACLVRNQQYSALGVKERFQFLTLLGISKWVVVQLSFLVLVGVLIFQWRKTPQRREGLFFLALSLLVFASLGISSVNSASGAHVWAFSCLMTGLFILTEENWDIRAWLLYVAVLALAAFGHAHVAIQHALADRPPGPEERAALLEKIAQLHPPRLYIDAYALRELYDYKFPANSFAFETSNTTGWGYPKSLSTLPKNSVSIVSVSYSFPTSRSPDAGKMAKPLIIFGHPVPGVVRNPYDLEIMDNRDAP